MSRSRFVVQILALGAAGVVTFAQLAALELAAAERHRQAMWAAATTPEAVQQIEVIGQRRPRS